MFCSSLIESGGGYLFVYDMVIGDSNSGVAFGMREVLGFLYNRFCSVFMAMILSVFFCSIPLPWWRGGVMRERVEESILCTDFCWKWRFVLYLFFGAAVSTLFSPFFVGLGFVLVSSSERGCQSTLST